MISNKLLSEVYNFEVKDFVQLGTDDVTYEVRFNGLKNGTNYNIINIYELAHKCKEWALSKGILLRSSIDGVVDFYDFIIVGEDRGEFIDCREFKCSEVEAIINACEWILDNKPL